MDKLPPLSFKYKIGKLETQFTDMKDQNVEFMSRYVRRLPEDHLIVSIKCREPHNVNRYIQLIDDAFKYDKHILYLKIHLTILEQVESTLKTLSDQSKKALNSLTCCFKDEELECEPDPFNQLSLVSNTYKKCLTCVEIIYHQKVKEVHEYIMNKLPTLPCCDIRLFFTSHFNDVTTRIMDMIKHLRFVRVTLGGFITDSIVSVLLKNIKYSYTNTWFHLHGVYVSEKGREQYEYAKNYLLRYGETSRKKSILFSLCATTMIPRLKTSSPIRLLSTDIIRRLNDMLYEKHST